MQAFIDGAIRFDEIATCVGAVMDDHAVIHQPDLDAILSADAWARRAAADWAEVTV